MFYTDEEQTKFGATSSDELMLKLKKTLCGLKKSGSLWTH
uniref:Uncharacterized protein n=1 Tax=Peronospora matthiolae TaxID=2874970 RepID=A0AAV1UAW2_9STRA